MHAHSLTWNTYEKSLWHAVIVPVRMLEAGLAFPSVVYVAAMTVFLFRPPDLFSLYADRIAFGVLILFVVLRMLVRHEKIPFFGRLSLPMLGLLSLAVFRALREPFDAQVWSLVASKFIVPFALFHLALLVFRSPSERKHFEAFVFFALAYLVFIAIAFLIDLRFVIFPKFILDESLGFHADRARGPFLQAVANGVSLNILGILLVAFLPKKKVLVRVLWVALPFAILATMTRAVWIAFAISAGWLGYGMVKNRFRFMCAVISLTAFFIGVAAGVSSQSLKSAFWDRTGERGPVEARLAVYDAGWEMFKERPLAGWPAGGMHEELGRRMQGYHLRTFYVHNTYLALLVEFGVPGLALYGLLFFNLFGLSWRPTGLSSGSLQSLRKVWPVLLGVYLFNAFFVDMAYQFVIGLVFTVAGMLCASEEPAR